MVVTLPESGKPYAIYYRDPDTRSFKRIEDVEVTFRNGIPSRITNRKFNAEFKKIERAARISYIWLASNWEK